MKHIIAALALVIPTLASAQGNLVLYCSVQEEWCRAMLTAFEPANRTAQQVQFPVR